MSSKHTPGPWTVIKNGAGCRDVGTAITGLVTCFTHGIPDDPTDAANARLIAAAPEMLQALTAVVEAMDKGGLDELMCCNGRECGCRAATNGDLLVHELRFLIAKATGEQP